MTNKSGEVVQWYWESQKSKQKFRILSELEMKILIKKISVTCSKRESIALKVCMICPWKFRRTNKKTNCSLPYKSCTFSSCFLSFTAASFLYFSILQITRLNIATTVQYFLPSKCLSRHFWQYNRKIIWEFWGET